MPKWTVKSLETIDQFIINYHHRINSKSNVSMYICWLWSLLWIQGLDKVSDKLKLKLT